MFSIETQTLLLSVLSGSGTCRRADSGAISESPPIGDPPGPGPTAAFSAPAVGEGADFMQRHAIRR